MDAERWKRIKRSFHEAGGLEEAARAAYLRRLDAEEPELASEVRRLLEAAAREGPPPPELTGAVVDDFELLDVVGRGGMGVVYRAHQRSLDRIVALKVLRPYLAPSERDVERFRREALAISRIHHPNVVHVLSTGRVEDTYYFAMEYVEGNDLGVELAHLRGETGATRTEARILPEWDASAYFRVSATLARDVADALQHAHDAGIVHRDVKPSNLLLDADRRVRVVDFGIARTADLGTLTRLDEMAGTVHYMSPEQVRAAHAVVDGRTDVYSLGVVLYELLTLEKPFRGGDLREVLRLIELVEPRPVHRLNPRVPRDLSAIVQVAMTKEPDGRYATAGALRDDLQRFLDHRAVRARPPSAVERVRRFARAHRLAVGAAAAVVATVALVWALNAWTEAGRRVEGWLGDLEPLEATESPFDVDVRELVAARSGVEALRGASSWRVGEEARERVAAAEQRLGEYRDSGARRVHEWVTKARDASAGSDGDREWALLEGLFLARELAQVFPDDADLARLASIESTFPTVSVTAVDERGRPLPATVHRRVVDLFTGRLGPRERLGATPLEALPVAPGEQRLVVELADGAVLEFTRHLARTGAPCEVVAVRRPANDRPDGMQRFEGGVLRLPLDRVRGPDPVRGLELVVEPFLLDEIEVSNARYFEFLVATGRPASAIPLVWGPVDGDDPAADVTWEQARAFLAGYGERPVTDITWHEAVAFAEWEGKRLPTYAEWLWAARGAAGRYYPYSDAALVEHPLGNVLGAPPESTDDLFAARARYRRYAADVRSHEEAASPEGVLHLHGNVSEMTETAMVFTVLGERRPDPYQRLDVGSHWGAIARDRRLDSFGFSGLDQPSATPSRGFRCAKSANP